MQIETSAAIPSAWGINSLASARTITVTWKRGKKSPNTSQNTDTLKSNAFPLFHDGEMICISRMHPLLIFNRM